MRKPVDFSGSNVALNESSAACDEPHSAVIYSVQRMKIARKPLSYWLNPVVKKQVEKLPYTHFLSRKIKTQKTQILTTSLW